MLIVVILNSLISKSVLYVSAPDACFISSDFSLVF